MIAPGSRTTLALGLTVVFALAAAPTPSQRSLVLLTLDTTRSDYLACYGKPRAATPNLDALAARGTRYARAVAPAPLTFPAHCSLMTGLDPPFHGVRDNGTAVLPPSLPTLATVLQARGYATGAFVASRVLDRRFGLDRGFDVYGDRMAAERQGEHGYPERDAAAVTAEALSWLARLPKGRPYFLWAHYYDPHSPYARPGATVEERYAGEVAFMDREIGKLIAALPGRDRAVIAAVGDHGEMLFEHGERDHGLLLYKASLEVPLLLAGPDVAAGKVVAQTVATRGLAATLLPLLRCGADARPFGTALETSGVAYSESFMPESAYGWSPLRAATDERLRYVLAPRPELYDFVADPAETRNLVDERPADAQRLRSVLADLERRSAGRAAPTAVPSSDVTNALRNLGYLSGSSPRRGNGLDPKDGVPLLLDFDRSTNLMMQSKPREALAILQELVKKSPGNVPFLSRLADAQAASGLHQEAIATVKEAITLNPRLDFLHLHLAGTYKQLGRLAEARGEYEAALALNPRMSQASLALGELAKRGGQEAEERRILERAVKAGTSSAHVLSRLAQIEVAAGELPAAEAHAAEAVALMPDMGVAWWVYGDVARQAGKKREAIARYEKALALGFGDPRFVAKLR